MTTRLSILFAALLATASARADSVPAQGPGVAFDQRIGSQLPLDTVYRDDTGRAVRLGDYFGQQPVVLIFGYSRCPQLCSIVANGTIETLRTLEATAGRDFAVVYLSIDPTDQPLDLAALRRRDTSRYGRGGESAGWHYLSGDEHEIKRVTDAAGFMFTLDSPRQLYAHASGFAIATPDGRLSRYFLGIDFDAREVAPALERAAKGETGEPGFNLLLLCARGLGITGRYGAIIWSALGISSLATMLALGGGITWMLRTERRRNRSAKEDAAR